jgi:hypothetical protein
MGCLLSVARELPWPDGGRGKVFVNLTNDVLLSLNTVAVKIYRK